VNGSEVKDSPKKIQSLASGMVDKTVFPVLKLKPGMPMICYAVLSLQFQDDNLRNNMMTKKIVIPKLKLKKLKPIQVLEVFKDMILDPTIWERLEGYKFDSIETDMSKDEVAELVEELQAGKAKIISSRLEE